MLPAPDAVTPLTGKFTWTVATPLIVVKTGTTPPLLTVAVALLDAVIS